MPFSKDTAKAAGHLGGLANLKKNGREGLRKAGEIGGEVTRQKGFAYYSKIGSMGKKNRDPKADQTHYFVNTKALVADYNAGMTAQRLANRHHRVISSLYAYLHQADKKNPGCVKWRLDAWSNL